MLARRKALAEKFDYFARQTDSDAEIFRLNDELTCASEALTSALRDNQELRSALAKARAILIERGELSSAMEIDAVLTEGRPPAFSIPEASNVL